MQPYLGARVAPRGGTPIYGFGPVGVFALFGQRVYTGPMTNQHEGYGPRQSTFTVETGSGYRLEFTVKGFVNDDAQVFASEILAVAGHVFNDTYTRPFEDEVVEMLDHKFRAALEAENEPSEYDQGWAAGRQAALLEMEQDADPSRKRDGGADVPDEGMVGKVLEVTSEVGGHGFPVGTRVTIIHDSHDEDPECQCLVTTVDGLVAPDGPDAEDEFEDMWEGGVTAWVGTSNTKKTWIDTPAES